MRLLTSRFFVLQLLHLRYDFVLLLATSLIGNHLKVKIMPKQLETLRAVKSI